MANFKRLILVADCDDYIRSKALVIVRRYLPSHRRYSVQLMTTEPMHRGVFHSGIDKDQVRDFLRVHFAGQRIVHESTGH